ncbi:MAG: GTPase ObgE [Verrucomicrobiota bacterium]|jgi:GTP-binding protein|nr:GTPase ObgE [Verrucomicrobiota bacterium]
MKPITFVDRVRIQAFAGNGGHGVATFLRAKFVPHGGPDGGDGGHGGSVYLKASKDVASLLDLHFAPIVKAGHGEKGRGQQQYGRGGADKIVLVPLGTEVVDAETEEFVGEVLADGDLLKIAQGGKGGLGNLHFKTSTHQAPTEFTEGTPGEIKTLRLTMKTVADVGLVGYPNAGKSTLLSQLSAARPKVASYPFTTLHPQVGTVMFDPVHTLRVADVPGLLKDAHKGVGLGHHFLRHIERTRFLLFVLDMAGTDGRNPTEDFLNLREELRLYNPELDNCPYRVLANKMDETASKKNLAAFKRRTKEKPIEMSAVLGEGVEEVKTCLFETFFPGEERIEF